MNIDLRTLALVVGISNLLHVGALFLQYRLNSTYRGTGWWVLGFTSMALGFALLLLRDLIASLLITVVTANALILLGPALIYIGVMRFLDRRENRTILVSLFAGFFLSFFYYTYGADDMKLRTVIISAAVATLLLMTAGNLFRHKTLVTAASANFNAALCFIQGCFLTFHAGVTLVAMPVSHLFAVTTMQFLLFLSSFAVGALLTFGLIIMVNQRLNDEREQAVATISADVAKLKELEGKIRRSEQYLTRIIDFLPDPTIVIDGQERIVAWNRAIEAMTGLKAEAMLGRGDREYALPFYGERRPVLIDMALHPHLEIGKNYTAIKWRDGTLFGESFAPSLPGGGAYLYSAASVLRDEEGGVIAAIECFRNDTERRRLYIDVKRYSAEIGDLYNNAPCGYHSLAPDGTILVINDTELGWLGYAREEIVGKKKWGDLLPEEEQRTFAERFSILKTRGKIRDVELNILRKDGSLFPALLNSTAVFDDAGRYLFSRTTMFDDTERRKSETALRAAEMLYRTILEHSQSGIYIVQEGKIRFVNPYLLKRYGYDEEELLGKVMLDFVHLADRAPSRKNAIRMLKGQSTTPYEYRLIDAGGEVRWVVETVASITYQGGPAVLGSIMDVTERRQMEKQLSDTREMLIQSEKLSAIGTLAAGVSHEILNPLNIIALNIQTMGLTEWPPEKTKQMLAICQQQVDRIEKISRDMNQFARVSTQETGMVSLTTVIDGIFSLMAPKFRKSYVDIQMQVQQDLPDILLDRNKVGLVIMNLANNAIDALEGAADKVLRVATSIKETPEGPYVRVVFSDTGAGIAEENLKKIFDPFFTTKEPGKGTGLGLATAYGIIMEHGGRIWAESNEWGGAAIFIELPVRTH